MTYLEMITKAATKTKTGDLDIFDIPLKPDQETRNNLYIFQITNPSGSLEGVMLKYGIGTVFIGNIKTRRLTIATGNVSGNISISLDSTEEELFQHSLVSDNYIDMDTLQQVHTIVQYGIDNFNEPLGDLW